MEWKEENMRGNLGAARRYTTGAVLIAAMLAIAAVAWACTVQIGTFTVCAPVPMATFTTGACARKVNTNGTGSQAGNIVMSKNGSAMSILGSNFKSGQKYSMLFNSPAAVLSGANCHQALTGGSPTPGITSLLGYTSGAPKTVPGPSWSLGLPGSAHFPIVSPTVTTTGTAKICTQDEPDRVDGTQLVFAVI